MPDQQILDVTNLDRFKELLGNQKKLFVVHFWASWANQCVPMDEAIKVLAEEVESDVASFIRVRTLSLYTKCIGIFFVFRGFVPLP